MSIIRKVGGSDPVNILRLSAAEGKKKIVGINMTLIRSIENPKTYIAQEMLTNGLLAFMLRMDTSLPIPAYWNDPKFGIAAGENLPLVGLDAYCAGKYLAAFNAITNFDFAIPDTWELKAAKAAGIVQAVYNVDGAEVGQWTDDFEGLPSCVYYSQSGILKKPLPNRFNTTFGLRFAKRDPRVLPPLPDSWKERLGIHD